MMENSNDPSSSCYSKGGGNRELNLEQIQQYDWWRMRSGGILEEIRLLTNTNSTAAILTDEDCDISDWDVDSTNGSYVECTDTTCRESSYMCIFHMLSSLYRTLNSSDVEYE